MMMGHRHNPYWKSDLPDVDLPDYQMYMFVDFLTEDIGPPNCVRYWVWSSQYNLKK